MSWGWQQVTPYMIDFTQSVESKEDEWSRFNEEEVLTLKKMARATGLDDPGFILFEVLGCASSMLRKKIRAASTTTTLSESPPKFSLLDNNARRSKNGDITVGIDFRHTKIEMTVRRSVVPSLQLIAGSKTARMIGEAKKKQEKQRVAREMRKGHAKARKVIRSILRIGTERLTQSLSEDDILELLDLTNPAKKIVREFTSYKDPLD